MAAKFFIQILSKTREKNWPASEILRVEWSSFSQKTVILVSLPVGGYPSQDPQNLVGMVPMGFKFCSQDPSMKQEKKIELSVKSKSQTVEFWLKKDKFSVILEEGRGPLGSSNFAGEGSYGP